MFQGEPFAEEDYVAAIEQVQVAIEKYDPSTSDTNTIIIIRVFSWSRREHADISSFWQ